MSRSRHADDDEYWHVVEIASYTHADTARLAASSNRVAAHSYPLGISALAFSSQKSIPISRYIAVAAVRCFWAFASSPVCR
jgi:hypothetical protein